MYILSVSRSVLCCFVVLCCIVPSCWEFCVFPCGFQTSWFPDPHFLISVVFVFLSLEPTTIMLPLSAYPFISESCHWLLICLPHSRTWHPVVVFCLSCPADFWLKYASVVVSYFRDCDHYLIQQLICILFLDVVCLNQSHTKSAELFTAQLSVKLPPAGMNVLSVVRVALAFTVSSKKKKRENWVILMLPAFICFMKATHLFFLYWQWDTIDLIVISNRHKNPDAFIMTLFH